MGKHFNLYDVVMWRVPEGDNLTWMVSLVASGHSSFMLSENVIDLRTDEVKLGDGLKQWAVLTPVGAAEPIVALDAERVYVEGRVLNSSVEVPEDDDDEEDFDNFDDVDADEDSDW